MISQKISAFFALLSAALYIRALSLVRNIVASIFTNGFEYFFERTKLDKQYLQPI